MKTDSSEVVDSVSPTEAANIAPDFSFRFRYITTVHTASLQLRSPMRRLRDKASHPQHETYTP